jgi:hypothetical protein
MPTTDELRQKYALLFPHLTERQQHLVVAADAEQLGHGGVTLVARLSGFSRPTIYRAIVDLHGQPLAPGRVRNSGAGRRSRVEEEPELLLSLESLLEPDHTSGSTRALLWTCKSTRQLAQALAQLGHPSSHDMVARLLRDSGFRLQTKGRYRDRPGALDRVAQFRRVHERIDYYLNHGWPVMSLDFDQEAISEDPTEGVNPLGGQQGADVEELPPPESFDEEGGPERPSTGFTIEPVGIVAECVRCAWRLLRNDRANNPERLLLCLDSKDITPSRRTLLQAELQTWTQSMRTEPEVLYFPAGTRKWNIPAVRVTAAIVIENRGQVSDRLSVIFNLIESRLQPGAPSEG